MKSTRFITMTASLFFLIVFLFNQQSFAQGSNQNYKGNYEKQMKTNQAIRKMIDKAVAKLKASKVKKELIQKTFLPDIENYVKLADDAAVKAKAMAAKGDYKTANEWATMEWRNLAESLIKIHVAENSMKSQ